MTCVSKIIQKSIKNIMKLSKTILINQDVIHMISIKTIINTKLFLDKNQKSNSLMRGLIITKMLIQ